jgi:hypothetical protein
MHWQHSRLLRIAFVSTASRESVTFDSSWLQKGHLTSELLGTSAQVKILFGQDCSLFAYLGS